RRRLAGRHGNGAGTGGDSGVHGEGDSGAERRAQLPHLVELRDRRGQRQQGHRDGVVTMDVHGAGAEQHGGRVAVGTLRRHARSGKWPVEIQTADRVERYPIRRSAARSTHQMTSARRTLPETETFMASGFSRTLTSFELQIASREEPRPKRVLALPRPVDALAEPAFVLDAE